MSASPEAPNPNQPRFEGADTFKKAPIRHTNPRHDQMEVGYYFAESKLKEYEQSIIGQSAWVGWFGAFASCLAAAYATKDTDVIWLRGWWCAIGITGGFLLFYLYKWFRYRGYTRERFLKELSGQPEKISLLSRLGQFAWEKLDQVVTEMIGPPKNH